MLRTFACAAVALVLAAGAGHAEDKNKKAKKGNVAAGTVKKVDAAAGTLTVTVKKKKMESEKDFKVGDDVKVVVFSGEEKKQLSGKDGLKGIKEGDKVRVQTDEGGNVLSIQVGAPPKKKKNNK